MFISPQCLGTRDFTLQHVTYSHSHGFMTDTLIVVLAVPWVSLLRDKHVTGIISYSCYNVPKHLTRVISQLN